MRYQFVFISKFKFSNMRWYLQKLVSIIDMQKQLIIFMASPNVLKVCFKNFALKVAETTAIFT